MRDVFFVSDTHYGHKNICRCVSDWPEKRGTRDFDTLEEMNQWIVDKINTKVKDGILYFLGDWAFGHYYNILQFRERIYPKELHLILGNHDQHIRKNSIIKTERGDFYTRDLFNSVQNVRFERFLGHGIFMSHYSHQVWEESHKGSIHLFGHSHGRLPGLGRSMDVGIDAGGPYSLGEVLELLKQPIVNLDQHV